MWNCLKSRQIPLSHVDGLYITSHISLFFELFILSSIILSLESFCGITYMQERQKLLSDFQVHRCVIGQAYPLPFTSHTFLMC